jgi:K+-transporting ATPase ATPase C chain
MPITRTRSSFVRQSVASLKAMAALTVLLGLLYPLLVWAVGQAVARDQAAGSLVTTGGRVVGSSLLGQQWSGPGWFLGRPSASDYAGDVSGGTNLAPGPDLAAAVVERRAVLRLGAGALPADALAASASGLDPHISPEYARLQVDRVAAARSLSRELVERLVGNATQGRVLGFLGEPRVNVLELNLALAKATAR